MCRLVVIAAGSALALAPFPGQARESPDEPELKDPWIAAGLSAGVPATMLGTAVALWTLRPNSPVGAGGVYLGMAAPAAVSAGHFYAGDPLRGVAAAGSTYLAIVAGMILGGMINASLVRDNPLGDFDGMAKALPYAVGLAIGGAAVDAYFNTERLNGEAQAAADSAPR